MSSAFVVSPSIKAAPSAERGPAPPTFSSSSRAPKGWNQLGLGAMSLGGLVALKRLSRCRLAGRALGTAKSQRRGFKVSGVTRNAATTLAKPEEILGIKPDEKYNVPAGVREKLGKNLLLNDKHPLGILWKTVQDYFAEQDPKCHSDSSVWRKQQTRLAAGLRTQRGTTIFPIEMNQQCLNFSNFPSKFSICRLGSTFDRPILRHREAGGLDGRVLRQAAGAPGPRLAVALGHLLRERRLCG